MVSSLTWLTLIFMGVIDPEHAPWIIYIPVATIEVLLYFYLLFRYGDKYEKDGRTNSAADTDSSRSNRSKHS